MSTGRAWINPWARPVISCRAAARIMGRLSASTCTMAASTSTMPTSRLGRPWPIPSIRAVRICTPTSSSPGSRFKIPPMTVVTTVEARVAMLGPMVERDWTMVSSVLSSSTPILGTSVARNWAA